ncbi:murein hydrolase activator EnvC family protein [Labilibacter marinus]|uniref:murein hydrolase activator EnvC family protein n=1 Tax=Labilibacter marinus TaxID=1477105 RepID=UPI00082D64D8|nr:peptidoglycan DD-metalloendopeptidase family protein [Labilibacter marinus]
MGVVFILKFLRVIKVKRCSFFLLLLAFGINLQAQNSNIEKLKNDRLQFERDIKNAKNLLVKKANSRKSLLNQVNVLNAQIKAQNNVVSSYKEEINQINKVISSNTEVLKSLEEEIRSIKIGYEKLVLEANKQMGSNYNEFMIVFSAESFSEAYRRFHLMKQYASYRKKQGKVLIESKNKYDSIIAINRRILIEKETSFNILNKEIENLKLSVANNHKLVSSLKKDERWLKNDIKKKETASKKLQASIESLIKNEVKETNYAFSNFNEAKGKLNWPVVDGLITSYFGEHNHSVLKGVKVKNNGIDIVTAKDKAVKCVYEGTVSTVIAIPGYNKAVIIRHGKYLTVYANLEKVNVKNGQVIKSNQIIGEVFVEPKENNGTLHFEIWQENKKINPIGWLKK